MSSIFFFSSCQKNENSNSSNNEKLAEAEKPDKQVLLDLLNTELYFAETTKLGVERATNPVLKDFAQNANSKHQQNYVKLKEICEENKFEIPSKLTDEFNDKLYKFTVSNNSDFDEYFFKYLLEDYHTNLNKVAKLINEKTQPASQPILNEIEANYQVTIDDFENTRRTP